MRIQKVSSDEFLMKQQSPDGAMPSESPIVPLPQKQTPDDLPIVKPILVGVADENGNKSSSDSHDGNLGSPPEITAKVLQSNVRKPSTSPPISYSSVAQDNILTVPVTTNNIMETEEGPKIPDLTPPKSVTDSIPAKSLNQVHHKFKFMINLESIAIIQDQPINCIIKYKTKFHTDEISTKPSFTVNPSTQTGWSWTPILQGYCEFSFSTKLNSLQKSFQKEKLVLNVYHQVDRKNEQLLDGKGSPILIGRAKLDLSELFKNGKVSASNEISCKATVPITSVQPKTSSEVTIGKLFCNITLRDLGEATTPFKEHSPGIKEHFNTCLLYTSDAADE